MRNICPEGQIQNLGKSRYGIIAALMKGVAFQKPSDSEVCALAHAVTVNGNDCILGAGRLKATMRSNKRRNPHLIKTNQQQKNFFKQFHDLTIYLLQKRNTILDHFYFISFPVFASNLA